MTRTFQGPGDRVVRVRATNPSGQSSVNAITVHAHAINEAPSVSLSQQVDFVNSITLSGDDMRARAGDEVTFQGFATNCDGPAVGPDHVDLEWDFDGDGEFDDGTGSLVKHTFATPRSRPSTRG